VSPGVARREDLASLTGYHSPQVHAPVRLNTNESPYPPPDTWREALAEAVRSADLHRYPDRDAAALRRALAAAHGVTPEEIFCANGSNEVLQCLLLAYGGAGRRVAVFEPTYALHSHIAKIVGTVVVTGGRTEAFTVDPDAASALLASELPVITFLCSPNNPTGAAEAADVVERLLVEAPGLLVVDEAYGQFSPRSALELRRLRPDRLVVVRTFSKTWAMAGMRLGYLVADPEVVEACAATALPYHLSTLTQTAGLLAIGHEEQMLARVAQITEERDRMAAALAHLDVEVWPSEANFILFRPGAGAASEVWQALLSHGVLVRDCSSWNGLGGCLRVTVGTPEENSAFLGALDAVLRAVPT